MLPELGVGVRVRGNIGYAAIAALLWDVMYFCWPLVESFGRGSDSYDGYLVGSLGYLCCYCCSIVGRLVSNFPFGGDMIWT